MTRRAAALAVLACVLAAAAPAHAQQPTTFRVGAAKVDTTPPAYTPASDALFAPCSAAAFPGLREYQFQEP